MHNLISLFFLLLSPAIAKKDNCLRTTVYYSPIIQYEPDQVCESKKKTAAATKKTIQILTDIGTSSIEICPSDFDELLLRGAGYIYEKGRPRYLVDYHGEQKGVSTFKALDLAEQTRCPYARGVMAPDESTKKQIALCLDPFFSVAADLRYHPPGRVLFFPDLVGMPIPEPYQLGNQTEHDGFLVVRDKGKKIRGANRVDLFSGGMHWRDFASNPLSRKGMNDESKCFAFRPATAEETRNVLARRGYPNLAAPPPAPRPKKVPVPKRWWKPPWFGT